MKRVLKVLIIEDHKIITDAYKSILEHADFEYVFKIDVAYNCTEAYVKIKEVANGDKYNVILLDIQLPASEDGKILSGEDLGLTINKLLPDSKIIINTFLTDNHRLSNILKSIKPRGFLVKNEGGFDEVANAIKAVIKNDYYYSNSILKLLNNDGHNGYMLDKIDRQLLYELSLGSQMKDLPNILPLEMAGIEKRKRRLKKIFNIKTNGNKELLSIAREKGFI